MEVVADKGMPVAGILSCTVVDKAQLACVGNSEAGKKGVVFLDLVVVYDIEVVVNLVENFVYWNKSHLDTFLKYQNLRSQREY